MQKRKTTLGLCIVKAKEWNRIPRKRYQKAADQGDAYAQTNLGVMYESGQGVEQDFKEALKWYQKAAEQGDASGQTYRGRMYYEGRGVEQDYLTAYALVNIAVSNGDENAKKVKPALYKELSFRQITKAAVLTKEMLKKNPKVINK